MSALRVIEMLESNQTTKLLKVNAFSTVVAMPLGIYCPYSNSPLIIGIDKGYSFVRGYG